MRSYKLARRAYVDGGGVPLASRILEKILTCARKLSRLPHSEFWRFLGAATHWRNHDWWEHMSTFGMQVDANNQEAWKHPHRGRPRATWDDVLRFALGNNWINDVAEFEKLSSRSLMRTLEDQAYFFVSVAKPIPSKEKPKEPKREMRPELRMFAEVLLKEKRQVKKIRFSEAPWKMPAPGTIAIEIMTDSNNAVDLLNGKSKFRDTPPAMIIAIQNLIGIAWKVHGVKPRARCAEIIRHITRDKNSHANGLSQVARIMTARDVQLKPLREKPKMIRAFADGSWKEDVPFEGGIGVVVEVAYKFTPGGEPD